MDEQEPIHAEVTSRVSARRSGGTKSTDNITTETAEGLSLTSTEIWDTCSVFGS